MSSKEIEEWEAKAKALADKYNVGVYLLFNDSMGVNDPTPSQRNEFARDYFIEHKLGVGPDSDGIIFVVSLRTRDYVTVAKGKGVSALDKDIDAIESAIVAYLKFDDWNGAAKTYYELVGSALENYSNA